MKRMLFIIMAVMLLFITGCNLSNYVYNYAIVYSPGGEVLKEGNIKRYHVGTTGYVIVFSDDEIYDAYYTNVILISNKDSEYYINKEGEHDT